MLSYYDKIELEVKNVTEGLALIEEIDSSGLYPGLDLVIYNLRRKQLAESIWLPSHRYHDRSCLEALQ